MRYESAAFVVLAALAAGCGEGAIRRQFPLADEDGWPRADTVLAGDLLTVEVSRVEPLGAGHGLVAWARPPGGAAVRVGALPTEGTVDLHGPRLGLVWADVEELVITEESTPSPGAPSARVYFQGRPGRVLRFRTTASGARVDPANAAAEGAIEDGVLRVSVPNLPRLAAGASYAVWLVTSSRSAGASGAGVTHVGPLPESGAAAWTGVATPASHQQVIVTVEFEHGPAAPALSSIVLRGTIPTTNDAPRVVENLGHSH